MALVTLRLSATSRAVSGSSTAIACAQLVGSAVRGSDQWRRNSRKPSSSPRSARSVAAVARSSVSAELIVLVAFWGGRGGRGRFSSRPGAVLRAR